MLFVSRPRRRSQVDPLAAVVRRICNHLASGPVVLVQALIEPGEAWEHQALVEGGFEDLAMLEYMQRAVPRTAPMPPTPPGVAIEHYDPSRRQAFVTALQASYQDTHDCPKLRGLRATDDVLDGHQATGRFDPRLWTLVRIDGQPVGVQLLAPIDEPACVELVYLGLAPLARGRGLGSMLLRRGLAQCRQAGLETMTLAVDRDNQPAVRLYRRRGFYRVARRQALIAPLAAR
jgi:ribosomal protein S18 acetylase RimI-like enzyme